MNTEAAQGVSGDTLGQICPVDAPASCVPRSLHSQPGDEDTLCSVGVMTDLRAQVQQQPRDIATTYSVVLHQQKIDMSIVILGSSKPRKLSTMLHLMRVRDDCVLATRVLRSKRPREAVLCSRDMGKAVMWATNILATNSHLGVHKTLKRLLLMWYWSGMTAKTSEKWYKIVVSAKNQKQMNFI